MNKETTAPAAADDCPLDSSKQKRNLLLFAACTALQYLAAPVSYVGVTQAALCKGLGASDATSNLPETLYLGFTFAPVIIAWISPAVSALKRNLATCYGAAALSQFAAAAATALPFSNSARIAAVILQAAVAGIVMPSAIAFLWESIGRGASESRRGLALGLAFGAGPLFAVLGSLGSQYVLQGPTPFPGNFAVLYACAVPAMIAAAILACFFIIPSPPDESKPRAPFIESVFGGLRDFLSDRVLLLATIVTVLVYTGNTITSNLNLYSRVVFGDAPMLHAGKQNAVRFAFKMAAGLILGRLLTRTNPKVGLLATSLVFASSIGLAMVATSSFYLLVFGLYGAGELVGVYAPNYILSASRERDIRRNMAFVTMMMAPAAPAGYFFGMISDVVGESQGAAAGFRVSFAACLAVMATGIVLAATKLPAHPRATENV